jgi:hypothetical protein
MKTAIAIWFAVSALVAIFTNVGLYFWLRRRHTPMQASLVGMPGYLDLAYMRWCREQNKSPAALLWFRGASLVSLLIAGWAFISFVAPR